LVFVYLKKNKNNNSVKKKESINITEAIFFFAFALEGLCFGKRQKEKYWPQTRKLENA
jgi:hypothetical protein